MCVCACVHAHAVFSRPCFRKLFSQAASVSLAKYGGGQVAFHVHVHTCALHRAEVTINRHGDWGGKDVAQQEVALIQPLQTLPTKKINKDIIKPSLSLNDYSHKCFNHPSLRTQLCVFVWVCVTVL